MLKFLPTLLQITLNDTTQQAVQKVGEEEIAPLSYWDLALEGGWVMIPIALLSLIAIYIFVERYFAINRAGKEQAQFMSRIKEYIHEGKIDAALSFCSSSNTPIGNMIEKGVKRIGRPLNDISAAIENVGKQEIARLERGLPTMATVAGGAPMIGFLGTVMGMIKAFYKMAEVGHSVDIIHLSSGIYQAMVTTVAGLIVGIIAYFAYNILVSRIENVVAKLEARSTEFLDLLNEPVK